MINLSILKRIASLTAIAAAFVLASGNFSEINAQRDPFQKPGYMKQRTPSTPSSSSSSTSTKTPSKSGPATPVNYGPPAIEARIEYFKRLRQTALDEGAELPKVTSVLTLSEMSVSGIFKTPRGYAAVVEATPIKLSYTIYPGEKFFDGQLVAVEENHLVFRKVSKVGDGKFVSSVENKPLKKYTTKELIEGTAPTQPSERPVETAANNPPADAAPAGKRPSNPFLSPVDEMNNLPTDPAKETPANGSKKTTKVAKSKRP